MPEPWPTDAATAAALLAALIREIDRCSDHEADALLAELLCAAWPTHWAQRQ
jgi:phytoene/squalene synthetase